MTNLYSPIVITGASGFVGGHLIKTYSDLIKSKPADIQIIAVSNNREIAVDPNSQIIAVCTDLSDSAKSQQLFTKHSPGLIINCAALTNTTYCEMHKDDAIKSNVSIVENILTYIRETKRKIRLIHLSTDLVFNGDNNDYYTETDKIQPINYYGVTKAKAETLIRSHNDIESVILRTSLIYGKSANEATCFIDWIIDALQNKKTCPLFVDEFRTPVYVNDLVKTIIATADEYFTPGIFHVAGKTKVNRYEFGVMLAKALTLDPECLKAVSLADAHFCCPRPRDVSLSYNKAQEQLHYCPTEYQDALKQIASEFIR